MPLQQFQKDWVLQQMGKDPAAFDVLDSGQIVPKVRALAAQPSMSNGLPQPKLNVPGTDLGVAAEEAAHSAPGVMAGAASFLPITAAATSFMGPFSPIAGILGSMGVGMATTWGKDKAVEAIAPEYMKEREARVQAHPWSAAGGRLAALPLGGLSASAPNLVMAGGSLMRGAGMLAKGQAPAIGAVEASNLANVGLGAGIGTGVSVGQQLYQGRPLSEIATSPETLEAIVGGALFNKPNALGQRLYGFHPQLQETPHAMEEAAKVRSMRRELAKGKPAVEPSAITPELQAQIDAAKTGLTEKKEGKAASLDRTDILSANQAAAQRGINPTKAQALEQERVRQAGLLTPEDIFQQKVRKEQERLASIRRKADFEKATLELQQQQAQATAEMQAAQAGKIQLKQQQQLSMKLGVQAAPEAIAGRALGAPENRPATARGMNKRVAAMREPLPVDPLQEQGDLIQDRIERKNQDTEEAVVPKTALHENVMAAGGNKQIDDVFRTIYDAQAKAKGADVTQGPEEGSYALIADKLKRMAAVIGTKEGSDTRAHETIGHIAWRMLRESPYAADRTIYKQGIKLAESNPELKAIQAKQRELGYLEPGSPEAAANPAAKRVWDAEEYIANQQGLEYLMRNPSVTKEGTYTKWGRDFKAQMRSVFGNPTASDIRRLVHYKWHNDGPFEQYFGIKDATKAVSGVGARVNQPASEGFNSKEGDDVLSNPQEDVTVNDHTNLSEKEKLVKARVPFLQDNNVYVTVQKSAEVPAANYVQVDENNPKLGNTFSANAETLNKLGYKMPSTQELMTLPQGKYTLAQAREMLSNRRNQPEGEGIKSKGRTPEEYAAQVRERRKKQQEELQAIRAAAGVEPIGYRRGGAAIDDGVGVNGPVPQQDSGARAGIMGGRPNEGKTPEGGLVSLNRELPSGDQLIDLVPDTKAVMPGESIADTQLANVDKVSAKETLEERIARKADEQLAKLREQAPDHEAAQSAPIVPKHVAAEEIVHAAELDHNYNDMDAIVEQGLVDAAKDRKDAVAEYGEDSEQVARIDDKIAKQQKLQAWIKTQDPTARVDLKNVKRVNQSADEGLTARDFMTSSERVLRNVKGYQPISQVLATIKNKIPPSEWNMLKQAGIEQAFGPAQRVKAEEVQQWIDTNGPKAEVHSYGMEGKVSEAKKEYDKMTHEWAEKAPVVVMQYVNDVAPKEALTKYLYHDYTEQQIADYVKQADKYKALKAQVEREPSDTSPRATSYYSTVSALDTTQPMPEWTTTKSGKNVQRVDVVIPDWTKRKVGETIPQLQARLKAGGGTGTAKDTGVLWQPDNLHENLPNTLGWAMIQYKTGPKGEKIAVIAEAQSRWGQEKYKWHKTYNDAMTAWNRLHAGEDPVHAETYAKSEANESVGQYRPSMDNPLDKDYNRLILKAAIEQAKKEGATHIMVSDAETAMMTEGHDKMPLNRYQGDITDAVDVLKKANPTREYKLVRENGKLVVQDRLGYTYLTETRDNSFQMSPDAHSNEYAITKELTALNKNFKGTLDVAQGDGMRLNYDTILPNIAEELTGSKGERVSLGEHKNAYDDKVDTEWQDLDPYNERGITTTKSQRQNLIFRNADGTPKTDVTGTMFPLPKARTEPYSYFERKNQPLGEGITPTDKADFYEKTGWLGKVLLHTTGAEVDKLKQLSQAAGRGASNFLNQLRARRGELEGTFNYDLAKVRRARNVKEYWYQDNPDYQAVVKWRDAMQDGGPEPFALNDTQKAINDVVSKSLKHSLDLRESFKSDKELGIEGLATGKKGKENYLPHVMAREAATVLADNPGSAKAKKLLEDFLKYRMEKQGQTKEEAQKNWNTIRDSFNQLEEGNIAARFGAIDKAMGKGLPLSMREQNLVDRMGRFNRRFARRVAYHEAIQRDKEAHDAFFNSESGVASTKVGKNILQDMFGIREHQEATRSALSGNVRALMLGPLTGAKDIVAGQVLGLQHMGIDQVLPAKMAAIRDWSQSYKKAIETGVVRNGYGGLESGEGGLKNVQNILTRTRDIINQVQGRQLLETVSRVLNYGEGRHLALDAFNAIRQGRLNGTKRGFLDDFVPDWQKYKSGEVPEKVIDEAAAKFVESVQGTYDYRGLPAIAMKGTISPYLSLARWNIEKFNNFTKHVMQPATHGNYKPLLMATIGAFIGGTAVNALVEEVTGRKERTAKWSEIEQSKEQASLIGYKLAALASLSGYAGMLGDLVKSGFDSHYKNRVQTFSNPLVDAGGTVLEDTKFLVQAMQDGDMPAVTDVLHMLMQDYIQAYRVALPHIGEDKKQELEAGNKRRDLKVWKMGEGMDLPDSTLARPNPLMNKDSRRFKQTDDMAEAAGLLPALIDKAIKKATDVNGQINPEILKGELSKYKRNSYQTVPSPSASPIAASQYMIWLGRTQGTHEASRRVEDYMRHNVINQAKSSMMPSF